MTSSVSSEGESRALARGFALGGRVVAARSAGARAGGWGPADGTEASSSESHSPEPVAIALRGLDAAARFLRARDGDGVDADEVEASSDPSPRLRPAGSPPEEDATTTHRCHLATETLRR